MSIVHYWAAIIRRRLFGQGARGRDMIKEFPKDPEAKRKFLLDGVERIGPILQASGPKSEAIAESRSSERRGS